MSVLSQYRLVPPNNKPLLARVIENDDGFLQLLTGRGHGWQREHNFTIADLDHPQFRLGDWDIEQQTVEAN